MHVHVCKYMYSTCTVAIPPQHSPATHHQTISIVNLLLAVVQVHHGLAGSVAAGATELVHTGYDRGQDVAKETKNTRGDTRILLYR